MKNSDKSGIFTIKGFIFVICLPLVAAALLFSCTGIFSTSLGEWAARDKSKLIPNVTVSNIDELIAMAEKDPDMSLALLKKIGDALDDPNITPEDRARLQAAALAAAVNATGMTTAILGAAGGILSLKDNTDPTEQAGLKPVNDAIDNMKNLEEANKLLSDILPKSSSGPEWEAFVDNTSSSDMAMAAVMIYCAAPDPTDPTSVDPMAVDLALACIDKEQENENSSGLSSTIANLLGDLGLIKTYTYEVQYWDNTAIIDAELTETKRVADGTKIYPKDITKKTIEGYEFVKFECSGQEIKDDAPAIINAGNIVIIVIYDAT